MYQSTASWY